MHIIKVFFKSSIVAKNAALSLYSLAAAFLPLRTPSTKKSPIRQVATSAE